MLRFLLSLLLPALLVGCPESAPPTEVATVRVVLANSGDYARRLSASVGTADAMRAVTPVTLEPGQRVDADAVDVPPGASVTFRLVDVATGQTAQQTFIATEAEWTCTGTATSPDGVLGMATECSPSGPSAAVPDAGTSPESGAVGIHVLIANTTDSPQRFALSGVVQREDESAITRWEPGIITQEETSERAHEAVLSGPKGARLRVDVDLLTDDPNAHSGRGLSVTLGDEVERWCRITTTGQPPPNGITIDCLTVVE